MRPVLAPERRIWRLPRPVLYVLVVPVGVVVAFLCASWSAACVWACEFGDMLGLVVRRIGEHHRLDREGRERGTLVRVLHETGKCRWRRRDELRPLGDNRMSPEDLAADLALLGITTEGATA